MLGQQSQINIYSRNKHVRYGAGGGGQAEPLAGARRLDLSLLALVIEVHALRLPVNGLSVRGFGAQL